MTVAMVLHSSEETDVPEGIDLFIPAGYDLFWGSVMFIALFLIFWKYVLPGLKTALDGRTEGIEKKLEQAEADRSDAQALLEQYREQLAEARADAARIRAEAQSERQTIVVEARTEAQAAAAVVHERAEAQLTAEATQVRNALSRDVGRLAIELAEKIVGESLDHQRVNATVDRFIVDLEAVAPAETGPSDGRGTS